MELIQKRIDELSGNLILFAPRLITALLVLLVGLWIVGRMTKWIRKVMAIREYDPTIQRFLSGLIDMLLRVMLILSVASMLGLETTSFLAILTSAGLAIGLALQGGLSNFAGGVLLLIFKPFKVGDKIESQGINGRVQEISIFTTTVITATNKMVIIPNGPLANGIITNETAKGSVRVDLKVNIPRDTDIDKAKAVILEAIKKTPKVLQDPAASIGVSVLADGFTTLDLMPYTEEGNYWDVYYGVYENVRKAMIANDIPSPIPAQIEIHREA